MSGMTLPELLWALLLVPLAGLLLLTLVFRPLVLWKSGDRMANIYQCGHCRRVYVDPRKVPISRCPGCRRLNEAMRR